MYIIIKIIHTNIRKDDYMDNIDIRKHIIQNFKGDDENALRESIESSIQEQDEMTLPGTGVFFELLWQNANDDMKNQILTTLKTAINAK